MILRRVFAVACILGATGALVASFLVPFVSSDFEVDLPEQWNKNVEAGVEKSDAVLSVVERWVGQDAREALAGLGRGILDWGIDATLGPVTTGADGEPIPWTECITEGTGASGPGLEPCAKSWIIDTAGIPVGVRTLPGIIDEVLVNGELLLGVLLVLFSICFPAFKLLLCFWLASGRGSPALQARLQWLLHHTA
ncbi:MAG: hypothetical protein QF464_21040, partial [Myxococcota bacterium]|nr:hypothetical protein [Myxococcota bacterium]